MGIFYSSIPIPQLSVTFLEDIKAERFEVSFVCQKEGSILQIG